MKEADLYAPVKAFLQTRGYEVKGEVKDCDLVAVKADCATVIVELKLTFSLALVLQGIDRQALSDDVYIAIHQPDNKLKRRNWRSKEADCKKLCRRLGLGLMLVQPDAGNRRVQILLDPAPYAPRKSKQRQTKLLTEFHSRAGDPNVGGVNKTKIVTAYRQNALRCAQLLAQHTSMSVKALRAQSGIEKTAAILQKNYYHWFERVDRGVYCLTEKGREELSLNCAALPDTSKVKYII